MTPTSMGFDFRFLKLGCAALVGIALLAQRSSADSWTGPGKKQKKSENGRFVAHTTPADRKADPPQPAQLTVVDSTKADGDGDSEPLWNAELSNENSPYEILITNDGQHVVTLDNWASVGEGTDVIAFYNSRGQVRRYALEEILADDEIAKVPQSTSSRWCREGSFLIFDEQPNRAPLLCIWTLWKPRWIVWDVTTGKYEEPGADQLERWTDIARQQSLNEIDDRVGRFDNSGWARPFERALGFLGWLRHPDDRPLILKQLKDPDFQTGMVGVYSGPLNQHKSTYFRSHSERRDVGDRALATFDQTPRFEEEGHERCDYIHLGEVRGIVILTERPRHALFVYLVPAEVKPDAWTRAELPQRLEVSPIFREEDDQPDERVAFRIEGVTPGKYWLQAVYDAAEPFGKYREPNGCDPSPGDFQSNPGNEKTILTVEAGRVTETGEHRCLTPVEARP